MKKQLAAAGVELLSTGIDEVLGAYKDIHGVMAAQTGLVEVWGNSVRASSKCDRGDRRRTEGANDP